jgi:hypothetical protein
LVSPPGVHHLYQIHHISFTCPGYVIFNRWQHDRGRWHRTKDKRYIMYTRKISNLNFSGELVRQQYSKMNISCSLFIIWMQNLHFWKACEILYNFHLKHIPRFWRLIWQKQMTSSTVLDFWQHRNINLQQLYLTNHNRYWGDSRAKRKIQKSTFIHKIFMTIGRS